MGIEWRNSIQVTLTVTNGAYTVGDVVGGLITLPYATRRTGAPSFLHSLKLAGVEPIPYELWFLNVDLVTPAADNAAMTLVAADLPKVLGIVPITALDYCKAASAFYVACIRGVGLQVMPALGTQVIYAYMKATAVTSPGTTTIYLTADFIP